MSLTSFLLPPLKELHDLVDLIKEFKAGLNNHQVLGVDIGSKGADSEKNLLIVDSEQVEPQTPTFKAFPGSMAEDQLAANFIAVEKDESLILRSYGKLMLSDGENWVAIFDPKTVTPAPKPAGPAAAPIAFKETKAKVYNRGIPSDDFLRQLVDWGKTAPDEIFVDKTTKETDVYQSVAHELGSLYTDPLHRKACMLEVLRVLAGFESGWDWNTGRDTKNTPSSRPHDEWEAGAWQVSSNSMGFGSDLKELVLRKLNSVTPDTFRTGMMQNHPLAMEYIARLLRHTIRHNGPVKRGEINPWLQTAAVKEFAELLQA